MGKEPKYKEIYNYFRAKIRSGEIKIDDPLPPEAEIIARFSTSHMTVNKAMAQLSQHGYIRRVPGYGTFACGDYNKAIESSHLQFESINTVIQKTGMIPHTKLISYSIKKGRDLPEVSSILKIEDEGFIHEIVRLKYGNDRLICVTTAYLSQKFLPVIDITRLESSLDAYVSEMGINKTDGSSSVQACLPSGDLIDYFGTDHMALMHQRIIWNINGVPFELTDNYFDGELMTITNPRKMEISGIPAVSSNTDKGL